MEEAKEEVEEGRNWRVGGEKVEGEKGKTSTGKVCHTQPKKDWKTRKPLLVKTSVQPAPCKRGRGGCQEEE